MTARIVLSCLILLVLAVCAGVALGQRADPGQVDNGIGTSPSYDDTAIMASTPASLPSCGIWVAATEADADQLALAGAPPNVVVFATGLTTCSDAIAIAAARWPGASVVRYAVQPWRARDAP